MVVLTWLLQQTRATSRPLQVRVDDVSLNLYGLNMKLDEKDIKFIKKHSKLRSQGFLNNPFLLFCMSISYSIGLILFLINRDDNIWFFSDIFVTLYWFCGLCFWLFHVWERNRFMKIIDVLYTNRHDKKN